MARDGNEPREVEVWHHGENARRSPTRISAEITDVKRVVVVVVVVVVVPQGETELDSRSWLETEKGGRTSLQHPWPDGPLG